MAHEGHDRTGDPRVQETIEALRAEIDERERTTAALAQRNAELHAELERRLTESESFSQVLVSLLRKTALEQVLDLVCAQAQGLIGALQAVPSCCFCQTGPGWRSGTSLAVRRRR